MLLYPLLLLEAVAGQLKSHSATEVEITIGLRLAPTASEWLERTVLAISSPSSNRYGELVPKLVVDDKLAPSPRQIAVVNEWLERAGLSGSRSWKATGDLLTLAGSREAYNRLMTTIPAEHVDLVLVRDRDSGTEPAAAARWRRHAGPRQSREDEPLKRPAVTPEVIWRDLDIDRSFYESLPTRIGIASPFNELLDPNDFEAFVERYGIGSSANLDTSKAQSCIGSSMAAEPILDVECCAATAPNATLDYYCAAPGASHQFCEALLDYLVWMYETPGLPLVQTFSYGDPNCQEAVRAKVNVQLQKLATQRVTTLWASGDSGGTGFLSKAWFPASSPWATAVGGTQLVDASANASVESWPQSGGGWDPLETAANYSKAAVVAYLKAVKVPSGRRTDGAPFPDVSAFAADVCGYSGCTNAGTSAATPIVASVVALLNAARASVNKTALGYINPLLYAHAEATMVDVLQGKGNGYPVAAGWDPVTGLGMPQAEKLRQVVMALP
jgi:hypothetical protein